MTPAEEERGSWLNEADFLTGGGPSEAEEKGGATAEEQAVVKARAGGAHECTRSRMLYEEG